MTDMTAKVRRIAKRAGYSKADIAAGIEFYNRKNYITNPPGYRDKAGRFYADERTASVARVREPSRAYPNSERKTARTADHCAELFGATPLHVKRICRALESDGTDLKTILKEVRTAPPAPAQPAMPAPELAIPSTGVDQTEVPAEPCALVFQGGSTGEPETIPSH